MILVYYFHLNTTNNSINISHFGKAEGLFKQEGGLDQFFRVLAFTSEFGEDVVQG